MEAVRFLNSAPLAFFGGPYSNAQALDAFLAAMAEQGVTADRIFSTGDLAAYCADAAGVIARVAASGLRFVRGNCEETLGAGLADCGCGFAKGGACDRLAGAWHAHALSQLTQSDRAFLAQAPARIDIAWNGLRISVIHGALRQTNRFIFNSTPAALKQADLRAAGADIIIAGHSGLPFTEIFVEGVWHNPGALGLPANDGTADVFYSLLQADGQGAAILTHHRLAYDAAAAARAMRAADLPDDYAKTLETGLWPNCDVLPPPEARAQGLRLDPPPVRFKRGQTAPGAQKITRAADKFVAPQITREGAPRGRVRLRALETLWINTGTLCNLSCGNCYIESSPRNDRLAYISHEEVAAYLDEIVREQAPVRTIGFTGGEPFMNRALPAMLEDALARGFDALVLTNAMVPMRHRRKELLALREKFGARLQLRVSLDHYAQDLHELERGPNSFEPTLEGLHWLLSNGFAANVAGRLFSGENEAIVRAGFAELFAARDIGLDAASADDLVLFPEMEADADPPEISESCWSILGKDPNAMMCASARMVVKRKGAMRPSVVACTLLPYDSGFELGATLKEAAKPVFLNHPYCATFCVLGAASCS